MFEGERLASYELRGRRGWQLRIAGARRRAYTVEASMRTLERKFRPCRVFLGSRALPRRLWTYQAKTRVLRMRVSARRAMLTVRPCRR